MQVNPEILFTELQSLSASVVMGEARDSINPGANALRESYQPFMQDTGPNAQQDFGTTYNVQAPTR